MAFGILEFGNLFLVLALEFGDWRLGFRIVEFRILSLGFWVWNLEFGVWGFKFWSLGIPGFFSVWDS